jgi:hypothetical protein
LQWSTCISTKQDIFEDIEIKRHIFVEAFQGTWSAPLPPLELTLQTMQLP